jgi:hypothetical protein
MASLDQRRVLMPSMPRPFTRYIPRSVLAIFALAAGLGCSRLNDLLSVQPTKSIPIDVAESPGNAQLLIDGAKSDFDCAFGAYVVLGGLIGEELDETRQSLDRRPYDLRLQTSKDLLYATQPCGSLGVYTPLQVARGSAERTLLLLQGWTDAQVPNRQLSMATMSAYAGYSTLLLAEGFCSTVISSLDEHKQIVWGGEISRDSAFRVAETRFSDALTLVPATATTIIDLAHVGRARTRLGHGDATGARADAALVSSTFLYQVTASAALPRRQNRVWAQSSNINHLTSVGALYRAMADPRVTFADAHDNSAWGVPIYVQTKYLTSAAPFRLASNAEARLIIAEADIATANAASLQNAQTILNSFRARGNQQPLTSLDPDTLRNALVDQRRRELFLEGQHLGDLIRFGIAPTPPEGSLHPSGFRYGNHLCLPLPDVERQNNPVLQH